MEMDIRNLTFSYDGRRDIFRHISLVYRSPEILCILGANGTGKSTLLKCLTGEHKAREGGVYIDGTDVRNVPPRKLAHRIAYIAQSHLPAFPFRVLDIATMGRTSRIGCLASPGESDREAAMENLRYLKIEHLWNTPYTDISGGERQLVMIAAALTQEPEALILDEPTSHLDFGNQYRFIRLVDRLREKGVGVMMTTHFPDHALELKGRTVLLKDGRIQADGMAPDVINDETMEELYQIEVNVRKFGDRSICIPGPMNGECES